jgi:cyclophilin family peptidyl-prolyl cis-trans isomerase
MRFRATALAFATVAAFSASPKPQVKFTTNLGSFTVELEPEAAPKTVANFLAYVRAGHFKGTTFHRVIAKFMIQGGGMTADGREKPTQSPVVNEAKQALAKGIRNTRGSIAMARTPDPHSATAQFFVNTVDNAFLDFPGQDGWGYCAFGRVVEGMATVDKIKDVKTAPGDRPLQPVTIESASVVE